MSHTHIIQKEIIYLKQHFFVIMLLIIFIDTLKLCSFSVSVLVYAACVCVNAFSYILL